MLLRNFLLVCLLLSVLFSACQRRGEDVVYLMPENFQGNVLIIFDQKNGVDSSYEGGKRVYKIDTTGVLRTKFNKNYGKHQSFFYQLDKNNTRIPLRYILPVHIENISPESKETFVYNIETGKDYDKKTSKDRYFELFTITNRTNLDSIGNLKSSFMQAQLINH